MNKKEKIVVAILGILLCYSFYASVQNAAQEQKVQQEAAAKAKAALAEKARAAIAEEAGKAVADAARKEEAQVKAAEDGTAAEEKAAEDVPPPPPAPPAEPERTEILANDVATVTFTSKGGAVAAVTLQGSDKARTYFRETDETKGPVSFGFVPAQAGANYAARGSFELPALALEGLPGLDANSDFSLEKLSDTSIRMTAESPAAGLSLERTVWLTNGYHFAVRDVFRPLAEGAKTVSVPAHRVALGVLPVLSGDGNSRISGGSGANLRVRLPNGSAQTLEQDFSESFAEGLPSLAGLFGTSGGGCSGASVAAGQPQYRETDARGDFVGPVEWASVRERFFVQILTPSEPAAGVRTRAVRTSAAPGPLELKGLGASLAFAEAKRDGGEFVREYSLYVGPRKLSELRAEARSGRSDGYRDIMQFGIWGFFCRLLLDILNFLHAIVPNYGVAIILLTFLIRLVLWPLNKRSQESMRKMSELQPKIKKLQELYKDDRRKLQAEQMKLYAEAKVNPLASCLPMLLQMPVLIAFFYMLGSCVELRHEPFLWVRDLSEPENLFKETLGFGVNLLPLAMAATMNGQSRLTPSAGDPSQQRMMTVFMPVMMLVICYNFASALSLYWSVSQALAIFAMWRTNRKRGARASFTQADGTEVIPPERETRQMRRERERHG